MSEVQKCDGCGAISRTHNTQYRFGSRVADIDASKSAIDVTQEGHLCWECAHEVAKLIKELGDD